MRFALLLSALCFATSLARAAHVPFVGCPSDGQQGPTPSPRSGKTPNITASAASRLSYYETFGKVGVLAPRGWKCFGIEGSNGVWIFVTPSPQNWNTLTAEGAALKGAFVSLQETSGGTSGRFQVAEVAARVFPAAASFVDRVEAEGVIEKPYSHVPYPSDKLVYAGRYFLLYTTAAGKEGLGTRTRIAPGRLPIDGVEILHPDSDMDLTSLAARLSPAQRPLVAIIIAQVKRER